MRFLAITSPPCWHQVLLAVSLYQLLGYNLLVVCAILALRALVLIFRPDR